MARSFGFGWLATILGGLRERRADLRAAAAAILGEKDEQVAHCFVIGAIDDRAAVAPRSDQPRIGEQQKLGGHGVGRGVERAGDLTGGKPFRSGLYQQAKDYEAGILRQRGKAFHGSCRFHISLIPEIWNEVKKN